MRSCSAMSEQVRFWCSAGVGLQTMRRFSSLTYSSLRPAWDNLFFLLFLLFFLHGHGGAARSAASSIFMAEGSWARGSYGLMVGFLATIGLGAGGLRCSGLCAIQVSPYV